MIAMLFWLIMPLIYATGMMGISTILVSNEPVVLQIVAISAACILPLRGIYYIVISVVRGNKVTLGMIIESVVELLLAAGIVLLPRISYVTFVVVYEAYLTFYIGIKVVDTVLYGKSKVFRHMIPSLCQAVFFLQLFLAILFLPDEIRMQVLRIGIGMTVSLFGVAHICDFLTTVVRHHKIKTILSSIRITMPGFFALTIPHRLIQSIKNTKLRENESQVNAEVIFHFGKHGRGVAGHCELCLDGTTYTYGNYDYRMRRVFRTAGTGIIIKAEREEYLKWCCEQHHKMIMAYGLHLDEKEMGVLRKRQAEFEECLVSWDREADESPDNEYIKKIRGALNAKVFKIAKGRFRTYFLPSINCVTLLDYFLSDTAIGQLIIPGICTPGAYMDVLHRLYDTGSSTVVSLKTYGI